MSPWQKRFRYAPSTRTIIDTLPQRAILFEAFLSVPSLDFSTVSDFLRRAAEAKEDKREAISSFVASSVDSKGTVALPPHLAETLEGMLEEHGDEAYRQVGLFCIGKWFQLHAEMSQELASYGETEAACRCLMSSTRIADALHLLSEVESVGGDADWRAMLKTEITQHLMEEIEEAKNKK